MAIAHSPASLPAPRRFDCESIFAAGQKVKATSLGAVVQMSQSSISVGCRFGAGEWVDGWIVPNKILQRLAFAARKFLFSLLLRCYDFAPNG